MAEVVCAACGKPIAEDESRYVDVHAATKTKVHVHANCKNEMVVVSLGGGGHV